MTEEDVEKVAGAIAACFAMEAGRDPEVAKVFGDKFWKTFSTEARAVLTALEADGWRKVPPHSNSKAPQISCQDDGKCHAARDGDCSWEHCPQNRDGEPHKTGRHCPNDHWCYVCGKDENGGCDCWVTSAPNGGA